MSNNTVIFQGFKSFQSDRARVQLMLSMIAEIAGFDPRYISVTPNVKPQDYQDEGSPYGWYYRPISAQSDQLVVQPIVWDPNNREWKDFGSPLVALATLEGYLQTIQEAFSQFQDSISEDLDAFKAQAVSSDTKDGGETAVTTLTGIKNLIRLNEGEYAALEGSDRLKPDTMYVIMEA